MEEYDVIVVGAGPAGGECARSLSKSGWRVLLLEKEKNFSANNFSSGGCTLEVLTDFALPKSLVGAFCSQIMIASSDDRHLWKDSRPTCLVLDFMKLRRFLATAVQETGGDLLLGRSYEGHAQVEGKTLVTFKERGEEKTHTRQTRVLIDASGSERKVLGSRKHAKNKPIVGLGMEYLLEVPADIYNDFAERLSFFIGLKWMPQGYAWIFPMAPNRLKVGVGRNFPDEALVPHQKSFQFYLDHLIRTCLKTLDIRVLDRHGKQISYTSGQQDRYFDQNILAIGDAVSTVNPLTFEGIRHALMSGRVAAKHVQSFLEGKTKTFEAYPSEIQRYCGIKWAVSEMLTRKIYREPDDEKISLMLRALKHLSMKGLKDLVFYYKFRSAVKFLILYQLFSIRRVCQGLIGRKKHRPQSIDQG